MTANLGDIKSITAYTHWLVMRGQLAGNLSFDGHSTTAEETLVAEKCRKLCDRISRYLAVCKENEIPELIECYDIAYRIGNRHMPDNAFIDRHKRRVLKAWKSGDRSIEESSVFGIVAPEVTYNPAKAGEEYVTAYLSIKGKWLTTLTRHNYFPNVTAYENYQRLALIMRESLDKELGYDADNAKRKWYEHNRVEDFSTLGSMVLRSYRRFIGSLSPSLLDFDEKLELDNRIISELSTRTDLDPYDREAFRMALEFNRQLTETYQ